MPMIMAKTVNNASSAAKQNYRHDGFRLRDFVFDKRMLSEISRVSSVFIGVYEVQCASAGGVAGKIGITMIAISLPLYFLSFNSVRVFDNLHNAVNDIGNYKTARGSGSSIDTNKLKGKLKENTFGVSPLINAFVDYLAEEFKNI